MEKSPPPTDTLGPTLAFLVLRLWLAVRAIVAGIEKFAVTEMTQRPLLDETGAPDPSGAIVEVEQKIYAWQNYHGLPKALSLKLAEEPLLPKFLLEPFAACLGWALIVLGAMLLFGLFTRITLALQGLIYVMLTIGLILLNQNDGVAWLGIHVGLIALALYLARYNVLAFPRKW